MKVKMKAVAFCLMLTHTHTKIIINLLHSYKQRLMNVHALNKQEFMDQR